MGFSSFQGRDTKYEKILANNQATYYKRKLLHFLCWSELSKSAKIWLSKSIFYVKNMNANLSSSNFFAIDIFWQLQFLKSFIFWNDAQFLMTQDYIGIHNTIISCWNIFLAKNLSDFVSLPWKFENPYYHNSPSWWFSVDWFDYNGA